MMTIREGLASKQRKLNLFAFAAWAGCGFGVILGVKTGLPWLFLPFFAAFGAAVLVGFYWLRCPRCQGPVGMTRASLTKGGRGLRRSINYCPYCGVSLDDPWEKLT